MKKILLVSMLLSLGVFAQTDKGKLKSGSQEEKMLQMHENMASCLREGKSAQECRKQVRAYGPMMKQECPMMDGGMMGQGRGKQRRQSQEENGE